MPTIVASDLSRSEGRETRYVRFAIYIIIIIIVIHTLYTVVALISEWYYRITRLVSDRFRSAIFLNGPTTASWSPL